MQRSSAIQIAIFVAAAAFTACGKKLEVEPLEDVAPAPLRAVMLDIDQLNWKIEPVVRLPEQFQTVGSWASSIQKLASDPAWATYMESDSFLGDRPLFESHRANLLAGSTILMNGAAEGDVDDMRVGFVLMQQSCIACHKRYQPNI